MLVIALYSPEPKQSQPSYPSDCFPSSYQRSTRMADGKRPWMGKLVTAPAGGYVGAMVSTHM